MAGSVVLSGGSVFLGKGTFGFLNFFWYIICRMEVNLALLIATTAQYTFLGFRDTKREAVRGKLHYYGHEICYKYNKFMFQVELLARQHEER